METRDQAAALALLRAWAEWYDAGGFAGGHDKAAPFDATRVFLEHGEAVRAAAPQLPGRLWPRPPGWSVKGPWGDG